RVVQGRTDGRDGGHDRNRDATPNDGVFDGGSALLGLQKTSQHMHRRPLPDALSPRPAADHGAAIEQCDTLPSGHEFRVSGLRRNWQIALTLSQANPRGQRAYVSTMPSTTALACESRWPCGKAR